MLSTTIDCLPQKENFSMKQYRLFIFILVVAMLSVVGGRVFGQDAAPETSPASETTGSAAPAGNHIIYVNVAATGANNGSSWANAYTSLQTALTNAVSGQEIWVAAGVYKPTPNPSARTIAFQLKNGLAIYGGFAGTETARQQRNWTANRTILSGDIDNNDITSSGVVTNTANIKGSNSYHVVSGSNTNTTAVIDGVTITAGQANGSSSPNEHGGGMYNNGGSPTITNVIFSGNSTDGRGGGMYNSGSSPELNNVTFTANSSSNFGGGLANDNSSNPSLTNVVFNGNSAKNGGGMFNTNSSNPTLNNVTFSGNSANTGDGGGMYNMNSNPTLTNGTLNGNSASRAGGMFNYESSPTLTNVTFSGNRAISSEGGGLFNFYNSNPTLTNVTFSGNRANTLGGGMSRAVSSQPVIRNSIFWNNQDNSGVGTATASVGSGATIHYSMVQGCNPLGTWQINCGINGGGNLHDNDPLLMDAPMPGDAPTLGGNLRLQAGSVALNTGYNAYNNKSTDLAGNVRIINGNIDLGAYERVSTVCPAGGVRYVHRGATAAGDGLSWNSAYRDLQDALQVTAICEIWIAAGVYKPGDNAANRTATFPIKNNVAVYGGFAGTETARSQRNWTSNDTILSGDIDNNDITSSGIIISTANIVGANSYHVVTGSGTNNTAVLDGVIITGGQANGATPHNLGGGMYNVGGSAHLTNVIFSGNSAGVRGGGMYNSNSSNPNLINVTFINNRATNNTARGGGMFNTGNSSPTLTGATFSGNSAAWGGGMFNDGGSSSLVNVTFNSNNANIFGGGMFNDGSSPSLINVTFSGNSVGTAGGGMYNSNSSHPTLTNIIFSGNHAALWGGGLFNHNASSPTLTNVTFSGNRADDEGGAMYNNASSNPTVQNSIFWHNQDSSGLGTATASIINSSANPIIRYSLVQGCKPNAWVSSCGTDQNGSNLKDANPQFIAAPNPANAPSTAGNVRLQAGSPAIDKGNNGYIPAGVATDLDGKVRIMGTAVDLGPYEHSVLIFLPLVVR
jgi:hypothetical protein